MPDTWAEYVLAATGLLTAGGGAIFLWRIQRRKLGAEAGKAEVDTLKTYSELVLQRDDIIQRLRDDIDGLRDALDDTEGQAEKLQEKLDLLQAQLSVLPAYLLSQKLGSRSEHALLEVLNVFRLPWCLALTRPYMEGREFFWVSDSFAEALHMAPAEVIQSGWRKLCEPQDLRLTEAAEARAAGRGGRAVHVTTWYRGKGVRVMLRWVATPYGNSDGQNPGPGVPEVSLAVAEVLEVEEIPPSAA